MPVSLCEWRVRIGTFVRRKTKEYDYNHLLRELLNLKKKTENSRTAKDKKTSESKTAFHTGSSDSSNGSQYGHDDVSSNTEPSCDVKPSCDVSSPVDGGALHFKPSCDVSSPIGDADVHLRSSCDVDSPGIHTVTESQSHVNISGCNAQSLHADGSKDTNHESGLTCKEEDAMENSDCPDVNNMLILRSGDVERNPGPNDTPGNLTELELYLLADYMDPSDFRKVGLALGFSEAQLSRFEKDHQTSSMHATYQMLYEWRKTVHDSEARETLIGKLEHTRMMKLADSLRRGQFGEHIPTLTEEEISRVADDVKRYLLLELCQIQADPLNNELLLQFEHIFTNLMLIEEEKGTKHKTPLLYDNLLKTKVNGFYPKRLLVEGEGGVGKTTLCAKIAWDWIHGVGYQDFKLVLVILLRKATDRTVGEIVKSYLSDDNPVTAKQLDKYILTHPDEVFLVLDGLDDLAADLSSIQQLIQITVNRLFKTGTVLITSRQWRSDEIRKNPDLRKVFAFIAVKGFSTENLASYITKFFHPDKASSEDLNRFIADNDVIRENMAPFPIYTAMLCIMWKEFDGERQQAMRKLLTFSQLFDEMIRFLVDHYLSKSAPSDMSGDLEFCSEIHDHLTSIGCVAFQGLQDRRLVFTDKEFQGCPESVNIGCKVGVLTKEKRILSRNYSPSAVSLVQFPHKLFQEYLSGMYLASLYNSNRGEYERLTADITKRPGEYQYLLYFMSAQQVEVGLDIASRLIVQRSYWDGDFIVDVAYESQNPAVAKVVADHLKSRHGRTLKIREKMQAHTVLGHLFVVDHREVDELNIEKSCGQTASEDLAEFMCTSPSLRSVTIRGAMHDVFFYVLANQAVHSKIETLHILNIDLIKRPSASRDLAQFICKMPNLMNLMFYAKCHDDFYSTSVSMASSAKGFPQVRNGNFRFNRRLQKDLDSLLDYLTYLSGEFGSFDGLSAPPEILARGPKAIRAYASALKDGKKKVCRTRLMLVGQEGVGKTSLKKSLTGQGFDPKEELTDGAETEAICEISIEHVELDKDDNISWSVKPKRNADASVGEFKRGLVDHMVSTLREDTSMEQASSEASLEQDSNESDDRHQGEAGAHGEKIPDGVTQDKATTSQFDSKETTDTRMYGDEKVGAESPAVSPLKDERSKMEATEAPKASEAPEAPGEDEGLPDNVAELVEERLKVKRAESGNDKVKDKASLNIWDFAGHDVYYTTHQVFLTWRAIYVIVFDLSMDLDSLVPPECRNRSYHAKQGTTSELTCLQFIEFWLNSIYNHAVMPSSKISKYTKGPSQETPPIFIVGTHREEVKGSEREKKEKIAAAFDRIQTIMKRKPFQCHVIPKYYQIENKLETDKELGDLRKRIEKVAKDEPYMGEEIPLRWLRFEEFLATNKKKENNYKYMTLDEIKALTQPIGIESQEELLTMLNFYHDLGSIIYYGDVKEKKSLLQDMVVLNPQWLINVFKQVITVKEHSKRDGIVNDAWSTLEDYGILEDRLIRHMWKECQEQKDALVELMMKFDLICKAPAKCEVPDKTAKSPQKRYYVPSRLPKRCQQKDSLKSSVEFYIDFHGFLPEGLFHRLMARVAESKMNRNDVRLFYRKISMTVNDKHEALLIMLPPSDAAIKVIVFRPEIVSDEEAKSVPETSDPKAVKEVRDIATEILNSLIQQLAKNLQYNFGFKCPKCGRMRFFVECFLRQELPCGDGVHRIDSVKLLGKYGYEKEVETLKEKYGAVSPRNPTSSDYRKAEEVTQEQLDEISRNFPHQEYYTFSLILGAGYYNAKRILAEHLQNYRQALMDIQMAWKSRTGGPSWELVYALKKSRAQDLVKLIDPGASTTSLEDLCSGLTREEGHVIAAPIKRKDVMVGEREAMTEHEVGNVSPDEVSQPAARKGRGARVHPSSPDVTQRLHDTSPMKQGAQQQPGVEYTYNYSHERAQYELDNEETQCTRMSRSSQHHSAQPYETSQSDYTYQSFHAMPNPSYGSSQCYQSSPSAGHYSTMYQQFAQGRTNYSSQSLYDQPHHSSQYSSGAYFLPWPQSPEGSESWQPAIHRVRQSVRSNHPSFEARASFADRPGFSEHPHIPPYPHPRTYCAPLPVNQPVMSTENHPQHQSSATERGSSNWSTPGASTTSVEDHCSGVTREEGHVIAAPTKRKDVLAGEREAMTEHEVGNVSPAEVSQPAAKKGRRTRVHPSSPDVTQRLRDTSPMKQGAQQHPGVEYYSHECAQYEFDKEETQRTRMSRSGHHHSAQPYEASMSDNQPFPMPNPSYGYSQYYQSPPSACNDFMMYKQSAQGRTYSSWPWPDQRHYSGQYPSWAGFTHWPQSAPGSESWQPDIYTVQQSARSHHPFVQVRVSSGDRSGFSEHPHIPPYHHSATYRAPLPFHQPVMSAGNHPQHQSSATTGGSSNWSTPGTANRMFPPTTFSSPIQDRTSGPSDIPGYSTVGTSNCFPSTFDEGSSRHYKGRAPSTQSRPPEDISEIPEKKPHLL